MAITFSVPGDPVPQPRVRMTRTGLAYTPDNGIRAYRQAIALAAKAAGATPRADAPLTLELTLSFVRPKSHHNKSGLKATAPPLPRGDCSNYLKGVEDALNGVAYVDDRQLGTVTVHKAYGTAAYTLVTIGLDVPTPRRQQ